MQFFDVVPFGEFMVLAGAGILVGFGLRAWLRRAGMKRDGQTEDGQERFTYLVGTLSQSAAIGLALTLVADLLAVSRTSDARVLAGMTVLVAGVTSFAAAFLREAMRRLFYRD